jgi:hypothetical protein
LTALGRPSSLASIQATKKIIMKLFTSVLAVTLLALSPLTFVRAQGKPASNPTDIATPPTARTDVYHVLFAKAALGKAAQLADFLKTPNPRAPMPGHSILLRHQEGDGWDYALIDHLGSKATVEATHYEPPPAMRDLIDWHNDTFVNGPAWADFTKAMGIDEGAAAKSEGSVYVVSVFRAAPGHREQLEKILSAPPSRPADTSAGTALMQHLEGGAWNYLTIVRYNSWQDFATNDSNTVAQTAKGQGGWFQLRDHISFHNDTLTNRLAP